jgi:hypothetical protein
VGGGIFDRDGAKKLKGSGKFGTGGVGGMVLFFVWPRWMWARGFLTAAARRTGRVQEDCLQGFCWFFGMRRGMVLSFPGRAG